MSALEKFTLDTSQEKEEYVWSEPYGYIRAERIHEPDGDVLDIETIVVYSAYQGQGHSKEFLAAAIAFARHLGLTAVTGIALSTRMYDHVSKEYGPQYLDPPTRDPLAENIYAKFRYPLTPDVLPPPSETDADTGAE